MGIGGAGAAGLDLVDVAELVKQGPTLAMMYLWLAGYFTPTVRLAAPVQPIDEP